MKSTSRGAELFLAIFAICLYKAQCNNIVVLPDVLFYNLTTTSRADFFVLQNQRQFTTLTKALDQQLHDFRLDYNHRLEALGYHSELLEEKMIEVENKLNPLELLDDVNDYCVQKYRHKLPVLATIKANVAACALKGNQGYPPLISGPEATLRNLKAHYVTPFANSLKECKKKFPQAEANYTTCITAAIKLTTTTTTSSTSAFQNQMKASACSATMRIKETFDCYGTVVYNAFTTIGEVMGLVDNCIAGHEFCPSCGDDPEATRGRCPYHMSWHLADQDLNSEKINNPFKGVSKTTPCLQINFITKSLAIPV